MKTKNAFIIMLLLTLIPAAYAKSGGEPMQRVETVLEQRAAAAGKAAPAEVAACGNIAINQGNADTFSKLYDDLLKSRDYITLVDKNHLLPSNYVPSDLRNLYGFQIRADVAKSFKEMAAAAAKDGVTIKPVSAYRSYQYQAGLYERRKKQAGEEHVKKYIAPAGASQHQLGTAIDINRTEEDFKDTPASAWLTRNAAKYGFSLSFPQGHEGKTGFAFEPWHYRYITPQGAQMQNDFFNGSQQDLMEFVNKCFPPGK